MKLLIEKVLNSLYQRQISSRGQLLNEMLRVKLTAKAIGEQKQIEADKEKLFQFMKKTTEEELSFFPADRDDFNEFYKLLKDIDIVAFALAVYQDDRSGMIISPQSLTEWVCERIGALQPKTVLITEAEKHLAGLRELLVQFPMVSFTLTTEQRPMWLLLQIAFGQNHHVNVVFTSIYRECLGEMRYDYIYSMPAFGYKIEAPEQRFLTRDSDGIAVENMLSHVAEQGVLDIIVPAKITFATMGYDKLRTYIASHFSVENILVLPEGTFRPFTAVKTYLFTIANETQMTLRIGAFALKQSKLSVVEQKELSAPDFLAHEDWRIELLLSEDDENIKRFKKSHVSKVKLKDIAEVFRGKSILKKDTTLGSIGILNLSNIEDGEINYSELDTIEEELRKIKRYELADGDVVLSCRGTAIKTAVFHKQDKTIIASANLIVIKPQSEIMGEYIKLFLESPVGMAMIKSFQRGTTVMNINHSDIAEMEIPLLPIGEQRAIVNGYSDELSRYKATIRDAEQRLEKAKNDLYTKLY